jgi:hypothetical protein
VSCHGFFLVGYKEFGSLLITDCTNAVNNTNNQQEPIVSLLGILGNIAINPK